MRRYIKYRAAWEGMALGKDMHYLTPSGRKGAHARPAQSRKCLAKGAGLGEEMVDPHFSAWKKNMVINGTLLLSY
ncbi:UNVERIFIED_CONTAM: hypothetical protein K2H54_047781 [Gekko kuhli]